MHHSRASISLPAPPPLSFLYIPPLTLLTHVQLRELVEVSGKERGRPNVLHDVLADGPGQAVAVVRGRATAQLVDDDQGAAGGTLGEGEGGAGAEMGR